MKNKNLEENLKLQKRFNNIYDQFLKEAEKLKHPPETSIISNVNEEVTYLKNQKNRFFHIFNLLEKSISTNNRENVKILDIGTSHFTILLKKLGYNVETADISLNWKCRTDRHNIKLKKCNLVTDKLPYKSKTFDIILFNEVLEHLPINPKDIISEFYRVLRKNGIIVLATPNFASLLHRIELLAGINPQEQFKYKDLTGGTHIREYTMQEVVSILKENKFFIIQKEYSLYFEVYNRSFSRLILKTILLPLIILVPSFRGGMLIIGKKSEQKPHLRQRRKRDF